LTHQRIFFQDTLGALLLVMTVISLFPNLSSNRIQSKPSICHDSPTRNPPACIKRPVATLVHNVYGLLQKLHNSGREVYHLLLIIHGRPANQPAVPGAVLCRKKVGDARHAISK